MAGVIDATKLGPVALRALAEMDADLSGTDRQAAIDRNDRLDAEARRRWPEAWAHMLALAKSQQHVQRRRLRQRAGWALDQETPTRPDGPSAPGTSTTIGPRREP